MKNIIAMIACAGLVVTASAADWGVTLNPDRTVTLGREGGVAIPNTYPTAHSLALGDLEGRYYADAQLTRNGDVATVVYTDPKLPTLTIEYRIDGDKVMAQAWVEDPSGLGVDRFAVINSKGASVLPADGDNRNMTMPFDNDKFRGYCANPWQQGLDCTSYECATFYDAASRQGVVVGSVEHDTWKTGILSQCGDNGQLASLEIFGGIVDYETNDVIPDEGPILTRHGAVKGAKVKSPLVMIGAYADWRDALEAYGAANAERAPKRPWSGGTIFAWQSWGGMADHLNYEGAIDVSNFFRSELPAFKSEQGKTYMVLDAFWDNMTEEQLKDFADTARANGQIPGIYWTPFSFWGGYDGLGWKLPSDSSLCYRDVVITAHGVPRKIGGAISLDPTHPATEQLIKWQFAKFRQWGYEYVKLDFLNSGSLEADRFYRPEITTGMQAYNYGMGIVDRVAGSDFFVDLSIAPVFPSQYGNARRIACDAWNAIDHTQYMLNSLSGSWWLDQVYAYNDPDHLVLREVSEGENRMRFTTGAMTGTVLLGDNFSLKGSYLGNQDVRDRALSIATNQAVLDVARLGRSFRPLYGGMNTAFKHYDQPYSVDDAYYLVDGDNAYLAVYNFTDRPTTRTIPLADLGLSRCSSATELWSGSTLTPGSTLTLTIPPTDVALIRLKQ
ncbi:MAG: alpha-galactosidase [Bacteroidales bacterium]|nr:alpha-galactosidase [Bacteroidales bacterium]